ncbi:MAG: hypothetical protein AAFO81_05440 [Pseudomonadota bacterium]
MNDFDKTLQRDAEQIRVAHADADGRQLQARLRATEQQSMQPQAAPRSAALWWLSGALVSAALVIVIVQMPFTTEVDRDNGGDYTTPVASTNVVPEAFSMPDPALLDQVSRAVALEEEWDAIQDDVARAAAELEAALPAGF